MAINWRSLDFYHNSEVQSLGCFLKDASKIEVLLIDAKAAYIRDDC